MLKTKFMMQSNLFVTIQLFLIIQLTFSSFSNYEEAILSSSIEITEQTINFIDSDEKDTYGIGFWSMCIPLKIPRKNSDFEIPFNKDLKEDGELLLLIKDSDTNNNLVVVYKILDYINLKVGHMIQYMNDDSYENFISKFDGLYYEGQWIFHLIMIQPIKGIIMIEVGGQSKNSHIINTKFQQNLKIIQGGRGYINELNLNYFKGLLSKLIFLPNFLYEDNSFENIMIDNTIPQKYEKEQKVQIVKGFQIFNDQKTLYNVIDQYGTKYCLSGWVKYNFNNDDEGRFTFLRMTSFLNYEEKKKLGDELFSINVFYSQINPIETQIIVHTDAYSMPVQLSFQSQYDLTFQGIQNPKYQVVESTKIFENADDFRYLEGLQQWHYVQYEYGRSNIDERMLLQIQFYNQLGLLREKLGNDIFRGSFVNHRFNLFFGGDNLNSKSLQIEVSDFQFQFNYNDDKELQLDCHFNCQTCKGPFENDCTSCDDQLNRYLQTEISMCKCKQGYFDFGEAICTDQFYSSVQIEEIKIQNLNICPLGYFRLPIDDNYYECKQCPQQMTSSSMLCAECYFYSKTWYLKPVCKLDLITIRETQDQAFHQVARNPLKYDLYTIGYDRELNLRLEFEDFCIYSPITNEPCFTFSFIHLGSETQMRCKSNYYIDIWNYQCIKYKKICSLYDSLGGCTTCYAGKYLKNRSCLDCSIGCQTCSDAQICVSCLKFYSLLNNKCQMCSQFCEICQSYYDDYLGQNYFRCIKCIDESKYILTLDGKQCIFNQITNCVYAFQALKEDLTINTIDINYQPQFDESQIVTLCAKCDASFVYVFETNECVKDESIQDCDVGIGYLNENDNSLKSTICLSSSQQKNEVVQFSEHCSTYNNNCQICLQTDAKDIYTCLQCLKGYYVTIPSGICMECPKELSCKTCYSQHSILKDRWKISIRAFYRKYIEANGYHQYTIFGQSQNANDSEVICSTCINGFKLHDNKCIQYCSETCVECVFQNNNYLCNKCQYEQRGRKLTLINNECIECPENCALCRLRTNQEIQQINPLFNNTKYQKYTYQCLKSYDDQQYYYDEDFGLFIECKQDDQGQGCYKQLIISLNLYGEAWKYLEDLSSLQDDQSKSKFLKENIELTTLISYNSSFQEFENDEFYSMANSKLIKSIIIKITNKDKIEDYIYRGGYLKQIFSNNIFTLKNVEIELNLKYETNIFPQMDVEFINFSKITFSGIVFQVTTQTKFIFTSYFQQSIILNQISFLLAPLTNNRNVNFQFTFKNISSLSVNNLFIKNVSLIDPEAFMKIEETTYPKSLFLNNITILECDIKTIFLYLGLGNLDIVEINNIFLNSNFTNSRFIQISQMKENGQIKLSNFVVESSKIFDSKYFFNFERAEHLEIINFQLLQTQLINSSFILLNRNSFLENVKFLKNAFLFQSFGIINYNNQLDLSINQQFQNILFQDNSYNTIIQFIKLNKYQSLTQKITFNQLSLINNEYTSNIIIENRKQVNFSLISVQYDYIQLTNLVISRGFGLNDIWLYDSLQILIENGTIYQEKYRFLGLHKLLYCQLKQVNAQYYSTTFKIGSSKIIEMKNLTFIKVLSYNFPIIAIDSADSSMLNQSEAIKLQDLSFISNLILYTETLFVTSLIQIQSQQQVLIQIENIEFSNNVFHQYAKYNNKNTAGLLFIICSICKIQLINSQFLNNIVLNSSSSIIYIETKELLISNNVFYNNSIFVYEILQPHLLWGFKSSVSQEIIKSIFDIQSISGVGQLHTEKIVIQNNTFINSSGQSGGAFSIYSYGDAEITIQDNIFEGISTYFQNDREYGGAIYIDGSQSSSIYIEIKNIIGKRIFCRGLGGFLYIKSRSSLSILTVFNLNFQDIYAQQGSLIYVSFTNFEQNRQNFQLSQSILVNTQIGFLEFLDNFKVFSIQSEIYNLINNRALIYVEFGSLIQISSFLINSIFFEAFSVFYETTSVYLSNIQILNSQISNKLISIKLFTGLNETNLTNQSCLNQNPSFMDMIYYCFDEIINAPINLDHYQYQIEKFQKAFCVYQEIIQYIDDSNSGLILFNNFTSQDIIQMSSLSFVDIQCSQCQNGLIFLQFQNSKSQIQQQIITSLLVQNSTCGKQGCLNVEKISNKNNRLLNEFQLYRLNYELIIRNYICQNNTGTQGTCLKIYEIQTLLENILFQYNEATQEGGSIYVKGNQYLIIQKSIIQFNKAFIGGGLYIEEQVAINYQNGQTKVLNNMAEVYGNDIASIPQQLSLKIKNESQILYTITKISNSTLKIQEIEVKPYVGINGKMLKYIYLPTGQKISTYNIFDWKNKIYYKSNLIFRVFALDGDMNTIQNLNDSQCEIQSRILNISKDKDEDQEFTNNYTNIRNITYNLSTQNYNLDDMIVYFDNQAPQDIVLQIQFICNSIRIPIYNLENPLEIVDYHSNYKLRVNIKTYDCQFGEIKNITNFSCEKCDPDLGLFSLKLNSQKCDIKNELTTLNIKDNQLVLRPGYWKPYFDTIDIAYCLNLQENCLGGINEGDTSCYIGHIGALCEQCDLYDIMGNGQYSIVKKFQCGPCVEKGRNIFIILGIIILTLIFLLISVQGNIKTIEQYTKYIPFKILKNSIFMNKNQSGMLIKMLTNYFQIIVSITTFQLKLSEGLNNTLNVAGNPLQTSSYSLDCFLVDLKDLQIEYARMIWQTVMPILYITIFLGLYSLINILKKEKLNSSVATTTLIYIYIYFQPNLVNGFIELISYRNISGFKWIQANVSQRYDTTSHQIWMFQFCFPLIIFISLIIPFYFFFGLYFNKSNLEKKSIRLHWGYLYNEYKVQAYFWELIKIIQKELIILSLVYYEEAIVLKGVLLLFITYVYQELNSYYQPYKLNNLNKLDYYSANVSMITIGLAIGSYISQQSKIVELQVPFYIIMSILNFLFLFSIISKIIIEYSKEFEGHLEKIKYKIRNKFPEISQYGCLGRLLKNRVEQRKKAIMAFQKLKKLGIPLAKKIIEMRKSSYEMNSKLKMSQTLDHFYQLKQEGLDLEKSSQNRMLSAKITN
ncbi:unnamed protein product [Paramecium sonneborni]|uniref:Uncharacterized protein n=1 Tax=Paramecium sonneborni TaxID=65129 RepID=A0A8S1QDW2_9CILI|nr:unnamed protein product [Paramecium sonneborni]